MDKLPINENDKLIEKMETKFTTVRKITEENIMICNRELIRREEGNVEDINVYYKEKGKEL